ncbi:MAG: amidase family protein [Oscillospiraceae bacterium]|nr:amidase family protein [Oscillospiraceae bacterium]
MSKNMSTILNLNKKLIAKEVGAVELVESYFEKITNSAFVTVTKKQALNAAQQAQKFLDEGKATLLTGVPAALKDNICTNSIKTTCSSKMLEDFIPPYDAAVVEKLKAQSYILIGKTAMKEFGAAEKPGESGAAAVVSDGICTYAISSDSCGSMAGEAAFHGLTALVPSYGRVSRYGLVAFSSSLDRLGVFANTAEDCSIVLNAISGRDERDVNTKNAQPVTLSKTHSLEGITIALPKEFFDGMSTAELKILSETAKVCEKMGAKLLEYNGFSVSRDYAKAACMVLSSVEAASNLSRYDGIKYGFRGQGDSYEEIVINSRSHGFGDYIKCRIMLGNFAVSSDNFDSFYQKALAVRQQVRKEYAAAFEKAQIILSPHSLSAASCLAGLPTISFADKQNQIGRTLSGNLFDEQTIITAASLIQKETLI